MGAAASTLSNEVGATPSTEEVRSQHYLHEAQSLLERLSLADGIDYGLADTATLSARLFAELDVQSTGFLDVEMLVKTAVDYFRTLPTVQPADWIRVQISKHDTDKDGWLDEVQFAMAIDSLRRC